jgi:nucleoside-specific outer membrane channel protein Tsx
MHSTSSRAARPGRRTSLRGTSLLLGAAAVLGLASLPARAADWSDAFIGYTYGTQYKEPGDPDAVKKNIFVLSYVGGYKYGVNFFTLDMLQSDTKNPAIGNAKSGSNSRGAQEVYVVYDTTFSLTKLSGSPVKFGPVRDVGIQAGFDFNSKNDAFGAGLVKLIGGPKLEFDVPGLLTLGLFYYKEYNNNGIVGKKVDFAAAPRLATVWSFDFNAGTPAVFKGWATYTGSKGKDGFGGETKPETWLDTAVLFDVGALGGKPKWLYAGPGYQYIKNKFGNDAATLPGSKVSAAQLKLEAHF